MQQIKWSFAVFYKNIQYQYGLYEDFFGCIGWSNQKIVLLLQS